MYFSHYMRSVLEAQNPQNHWIFLLVKCLKNYSSKSKIISTDFEFSGNQGELSQYYIHDIYVAMSHSVWYTLFNILYYAPLFIL